MPPFLEDKVRLISVEVTGFNISEFFKLLYLKVVNI